MPTIQDLNELNLKIANAESENTLLDDSINGTNVPGGNWKESLTKNCGGAVWQPNTPAPPVSSSFPNNGAINCPAIWNLITTRTNKIAANKANIIIWKGQVAALLADPTIQQEIQNQKQKRQIIMGIVAIVVVSALTAVGVYLWKKYKK